MMWARILLHVNKGYGNLTFIVYLVGAICPARLYLTLDKIYYTLYIYSV
jgi:hypothetical protein